MHDGGSFFHRRTSAEVGLAKNICTHIFIDAHTIKLYLRSTHFIRSPEIILGKI